jgi:hypothetical protein
MSNALQAAAGSSAARARRKRGECAVIFEVRDSEVEALVTAGYLDGALAGDRSAIADALGRLLDQIQPEWWPRRRL